MAETGVRIPVAVWVFHRACPVCGRRSEQEDEVLRFLLWRALGLLAVLWPLPLAGMAARRRARTRAAGIRVHGDLRPRFGESRPLSTGLRASKTASTALRRGPRHRAPRTMRSTHCRALWQERRARSGTGLLAGFLRRGSLPCRWSSLGGLVATCTLACTATATVCADASGDISHRQGERGSGRGDVRGAAQAPAVSLVAAAAAGSAVGGARGAPRARRGVAGGERARLGMEEMVQAALRTAYPNCRLVADRQWCPGRPPSVLAAEEARRVHQARRRCSTASSTSANHR